MNKENTLKAKQLLKTKEITPQKLAEAYIYNKAAHYTKIVEETEIYWRGYHADCFKSAENECLKSGTYLNKS